MRADGSWDAHSVVNGKLVYDWKKDKRFDAFANGTKALSNAIADSEAFSIAGGGDTLAAIAKFGIADKISYISTGGGAFLEFLEGKKLPALEVLEQRYEG